MEPKTNGPGTVDRTSPFLLAERTRRLLDQLAEAHDTFDQIAERLQSGARRLREEGQPLPYPLLEEVGESHRILTRLRRDVIALATALDIGLQPPPALGTLKEIRTWVLDQLELSPEDVASLTSRETKAPAIASPVPNESPAEPLAEPHSDGTSTEPAELIEASESLALAGNTQHIEVAEVEEPPSTFEEERHRATLDALGVSPSVGTPSSVQPETSHLPWDTPVPLGLEPLPEEPSSEEPSAPSNAEPPVDEARQKTLEALGRVEVLESRDASVQADLESIKELARVLRVRVERGDPDDHYGDPSRLVRGEHPLNHLLTILQGDDDLSDSDWAGLHQSVSEAFGKGIAVAAARNRLQFRSS